MAVEIDSDKKEMLAVSIMENLGNNLQFSNGCWISLKDDNGIFWGVSPYGQNWGCNSGANAVTAIMNWIAYWDVPRTETGENVLLA